MYFSVLYRIAVVYCAMIHYLKNLGIKPLDHEMKCYDGQLILTLTSITIQSEDQNNTIVRFLNRQLGIKAMNSIQINILHQEAYRHKSF